MNVGSPSLRRLAADWYGEVPASWSVQRFRRVAEIRNGQVDPEDHRFRDLPLLAPNHIESATGRLLAFESAAEQGAESGKYLVRAGEIVYSKIRPALRKVALATQDGLCSADMYPIQPRPMIEPRFLLYALLSEGFYRYSLLESNRVAMPKINRQALGDCPVVFPDRPQQKRIVTFLDRKTAAIDSLIAKKERLIELLQEKRDAAITKAVTGGLKPNVPMKGTGNEWLGMLPAHWQKTRLKHACSVIVDGVHSTPEYVDSGVPFVTVKNLTAGEGISFADVNFITEHDHRAFTRRARPSRGDVLITKDGTLGVCRVIETDEPFSIFVSVALLKLRKPLVDPYYLRFVLESPLVWNQFQSRRLGSALKHIHLNVMADVEIPLPPVDEQRAIADSVRRIAANVDVAQHKVRLHVGKLREYRQALISAAVTGKLDIPVSEEAA